MRTLILTITAIAIIAAVFIYNLKSCRSVENPLSSSSETVSSSSGLETVKIGEQVWMLKNSDIEPTDNNSAANHWCYTDDTYPNAAESCVKWGRLYDWATAMALPAKCNDAIDTDTDCTIETPHQGVCPYGYHIPTNDEWDELFKYADEKNDSTNLGNPYDSETAGKHLKDTDGWNDCGSTGAKNYCLDTYGFSALPGGYRSDNGNFSDAGYYGYWWSASQDGSQYGYRRFISYSLNGAFWDSSNKLNSFSVRCIKN